VPPGIERRQRRSHAFCCGPSLEQRKGTADWQAQVAGPTVGLSEISVQFSPNPYLDSQILPRRVHAESKDGNPQSKHPVPMPQHQTPLSQTAPI